MKRTMANSLIKLNNNPSQNLDSKYGYLNKKIKDILDTDDKNIRPFSQSKPIITGEIINKSILIKKN
jgi:hypothetical protein